MIAASPSASLHSTVKLTPFGINALIFAGQDSGLIFLSRG